MSRQTVTPNDVFKDQSLSDILSWNDHVKYHDVYYHDDKNLCITYLDPTTYSAWCVYHVFDFRNTRFQIEYISHLKDMGYLCAYFPTEFSGTQPLTKPIIMGHIHDMFYDTEFTHRYLI